MALLPQQLYDARLYQGIALVRAVVSCHLWRRSKKRRLTHWNPHMVPLLQSTQSWPRKPCQHVQKAAYSAGMKPAAARRSATMLETLLLDLCGFWQWPQAWGTSQAPFSLAIKGFRKQPYYPGQKDIQRQVKLFGWSTGVPAAWQTLVSPDTTLAWPGCRCFILGHARCFILGHARWCFILGHARLHMETPRGRHLHPDLALRHRWCKGISQMPSAWVFASPSSEDCFS